MNNGMLNPFSILSDQNISRLYDLYKVVNGLLTPTRVSCWILISMTLLLIWHEGHGLMDNCPWLGKRITHLSCQNQQNGMSDQRLLCPHEESLGPNSYTLSAQQRLWSDWADAWADLSLHWVHSHFVGLVMGRLIYFPVLFCRKNLKRLSRTLSRRKR